MSVNQSGKDPNKTEECVLGNSTAGCSQGYLSSVGCTQLRVVMNRVIAPAIRAMATISCTMKPAPPKNTAATGVQATKRTPRTSRIMPKKIFRKVTI